MIGGEVLEKTRQIESTVHLGGKGFHAYYG
jgi:hypothetical protein